MGNLVRDLQFAIRGLNKNRGTTAVILLALALGIGVNTSCFIMVNKLVLHPLPYPESDRIMTLWEAPAGASDDRGAVAPANFLDWREQAGSFARLAAFRSVDANLSGIDDPERVQVCQVSAGYFELLGFKPELGRAFRAAEYEAGARVALVSYRFWKRQMASAPDAAGRTITLNGEDHIVAGVMPDAFNFPLETEIWAPLALNAAGRHDRENHSLAVLGRLGPGVPVQQARAEMSAIARRLALAHPDTNARRDAVVVPVLELTNNVTDRFVVILWGTAGFVLLLASANVANLLLMRLANRQREMSIRAAMGASRARIVQILTIESTVLALAAGVLGLLLASWNLSLTTASTPQFVLRWVAGFRDLRIDGTAVAFTMVASVVTGLLCAAPAILHVVRGASSWDLNEALKEGGRGGTSGRSRSRLRTVLAVSEVALAMVLMVGAGAMVRTFQRLLAADPGHRIAGLLRVRLSLPGTRYSSPALITGFQKQLLAGLRQTPGAISAAVSGELNPSDGIRVEGRPDPVPGEPLPSVRSVSDSFFETLGFPVLAGRPISPGDDLAFQPVVVLSQSIARHYFPDSSPIGRRIRIYRRDPRWLTVVGVAGDLKDWFSNRTEPRVYLSNLQTPVSDASVYVRAAGDPLLLANPTRAEVRKLDRSQPVFDVKSMEQVMSEQTSGVRGAAGMMVSYAVISLLLAAMGIYAVISYSVAQRTHEIGIRMALGADESAVVSMTLRNALRTGAIGLAIGLPSAWILMRIMSGVLYGVIRMEAPIFAGMTLALAAAAGLAGWIPARRAARVDPLDALRNE